MNDQPSPRRLIGIGFIVRIPRCAVQIDLRRETPDEVDRLIECGKVRRFPIGQMHDLPAPPDIRRLAPQPNDERFPDEWLEVIHVLGYITQELLEVLTAEVRNWRLEVRGWRLEGE